MENKKKERKTDRQTDRSNTASAVTTGCLRLQRRHNNESVTTVDITSAGNFIDAAQLEHLHLLLGARHYTIHVLSTKRFTFCLQLPHRPCRSSLTASRRPGTMHGNRPIREVLHIDRQLSVVRQAVHHNQQH